MRRCPVCNHILYRLTIKTKGIPVKMEDGRVVEFCELADATDVILDIADFPELKGEGDDNN